MLLHVQDFRGCRYTGPGIQSRLVYYAMEIHNTNGRCWMILHSFAFFGRRFLAEANCTKGWFVFIRPKRICVSVSDGERAWLILFTVLHRQSGFRRLFHGVWNCTCFIYFPEIFSTRFSFVTCQRPPVKRCHALLCWLDATCLTGRVLVLVNLFGRTSLSYWWLRVCLGELQRRGTYMIRWAIMLDGSNSRILDSNQSLPFV